MRTFKGVRATVSTLTTSLKRCTQAFEATEERGPRKPQGTAAEAAGEGFLEELARQPDGQNGGREDVCMCHLQEPREG